MAKVAEIETELRPVGSSSDIELASAVSGSGNMRTRMSTARDNEELQRTGKIPVLKRRFGWLGVVGISTLILATWEGALLLFGIGFVNGGPAGLIYGFLVVWAGTLATFVSLAELASMAPTAGGQYHWVSILAPASCQKVLSYVTGWLTVSGWQAANAAGNYLAAGMVQGLIILVKPDYVPELWHGTLLFYAAVALSVFMNTVVGTQLPKTESFFFVLYVLGFFALVVPLVYLSPHASAADVFATFINNGGWPSMGVSFFVGLSGNAFLLIGADSVYHMSEEIHEATTMVPKAMIASIIVNGILGLGMYLAVLFCIGDVNAVLTSPFPEPFIEVFLQGTQSVTGTAIMVAIVTIALVGGCIGYIAAASRQLWAFSRDKGVPGWSYISRVDAKSTIPTNAIFTTTIYCVLIGLISIGSPVAFNDVISLAVGALYASYMMACALLLWRRTTGAIKDASSLPGDAKMVNLPGNDGNLVWGPWRVKGWLGTAINAFACAYLGLILIFTWWPVAIPVTAANMNYSSLVFAVVAILSAAYYFIQGRKTYTGPIIESSMNEGGASMYAHASW